MAPSTTDRTATISIRQFALLGVELLQRRVQVRFAVRAILLEELEQAGHHTKEECVRHAYDHESDGAQHGDEETGQQRCAHVRGERVIDVLEQLGAASAKPTPRKGQENIPAERLAVLQ